jgi:tetratricopeptide (TPR) repeat protein
MRYRRRNLGLVALFALGMLLVQAPLQDGVNRARPRVFDPSRRDPRQSIASIRGPTPVLIAALGGFRTVAADLLWLKVDQLWDGGAWYLLPSVLESVVQLDPHFLLGWEVYGWHLAYNLNTESVLEVDKHHWLDQGLQVLDRAVALNPDSYQMAFELGWTCFDRAHDMPKAAEYFYRASQLPGARSFTARLHYKAYERTLNFEKLWPALEYARSQHQEEPQHQKLVKSSIEWWKTHQRDPQWHRYEIVRENSARQQRAVRFYLYPGNPYWNVCDRCGLPTKKGEPVCSVCGRPFPPASPKPG